MICTPFYGTDGVNMFVFFGRESYHVYKRGKKHSKNPKKKDLT